MILSVDDSLEMYTQGSREVRGSGKSGHRLWLLEQQNVDSPMGTVCGGRGGVAKLRTETRREAVWSPVFQEAGAESRVVSGSCGGLLSG